mmetsp:Transcript_4411/g.13381  ORF Transcript_4411/g.13381 Transcript_4411/m.13381 type:complete len:328 (-) Transcript_4411:592-1575(-)
MRPFAPLSTCPATAFLRPVLTLLTMESTGMSSRGTSVARLPTTPAEVKTCSEMSKHCKPNWRICGQHSLPTSEASVHNPAILAQTRAPSTASSAWRETSSAGIAATICRIISSLTSNFAARHLSPPLAPELAEELAGLVLEPSSSSSSSSSTMPSSLTTSFLSFFPSPSAHFSCFFSPRFGEASAAASTFWSSLLSLFSSAFSLLTFFSSAFSLLSFFSSTLSFSPASSSFSPVTPLSSSFLSSGVEGLLASFSSFSPAGQLSSLFLSSATVGLLALSFSFDAPTARPSSLFGVADLAALVAAAVSSLSGELFEDLPPPPRISKICS